MSLATALWIAVPLSAIHLALRKNRAALAFQLAVDVGLLLLPGRILLSGAHLGPGPLHGESWGTVRTVRGSPDQVDLPTQLHVWWEEVRRTVADGDPPWISTRIGGGLPLFANGQSGLLFPPQAPVWFLGAERGTDVMAVFKLELAALGAFLLLRRFGVRAAAAASGGLAWGFGVGLVSWLVSPMGWVYAAAPWALFLASGCARGRRRDGAALALLFGALLGGGVSPEAGAFLLLATAAAGAVLGFGKGRRLVRVAVPLALAIPISAVGALPVLLNVLGSSKYDASAVPQAVPAALRAMVASAFLVPWRYGHPADPSWTQPFAAVALALGVGTAVVALAAAALPRRRHRRAALAFASVGLLGAGFLFIVPGFRELFLLLPLFPRMLWHRAGFLPGLALALLGALGLESWLSKPRRWRLAAAAVAVQAVVVALLLTSPVKRLPSAAFATAGIPALLAVGTVAGGAAGGVAIPAVVGLEALLTSWSIVPASRPAEAPAAVRELKRRASADGRRFMGTYGALPPNLGARLGVSDIRANEPVRPRRLTALHRAFGAEGDELPGAIVSPWPGLAGAWGVEWLLSPAPLLEGAPHAAGWESLGTFEGGTIYRNTRALPVVRVAGSETAAPGAWDAVADATEFARTAVVEAPLGLAGSGSSTELEARPHRVSVRVDCVGRCLAVLHAPLAPGWVASVDGAPAPLVPANIAAMGVVVPTGTHVVSWRYAPPGLLAGMGLSALGLTGGAALARGKWRSA
ncbi:MAG TPA: hypothetical protein VLH41_05395 [Thermoanaerobaculia bacterium]|nr:hypothetical protein [Thermoanaerobaculia bacterium]